jgi:hypothetical protein
VSSECTKKSQDRSPPAMAIPVIIITNIRRAPIKATNGNNISTDDGSTLLATLQNRFLKE